ncbi:mitochondrial metalloendopeptidase OMA1-like [Triticum aestivum]|uniref:mitochondrial metalloendopeptidase OMA1-like n=1 Tax=Triticum aestivum TaxID=4565 RepID=UPI0008452610|nr:mitochondrial metalloendopeptidase OMA1-like [Triticum aestivum]
MDQTAALPIVDILIGLLGNKPAAFRAPGHKKPAAVRLPRRLAALGEKIHGLFFHSVQPAVRRPSSLVIIAPPPLQLPLPLPSPKLPEVLGSIQGLFIPGVWRRSPQPQATEAQAQPSQKEILESIQKLLRHVKPAVCRPLALPLAAHIAGSPAATAALVVGSAAMAVCQRYRLEVVPYSNRVHIVFHPPDYDRELDEFEFAHFKKTNARRILRPRHYQSARVRRLTSEIVGAIDRGLAIKSKQGMARIVRPHTRHLDKLNWEVVVTKNRECNAYVHPGGGKIVVFDGLLERFETDEEIAYLIAHEVGHVVQRCNSEWLSIPSPRLESEADYIGIMLLAAAGFDPQVAPKFFEKFADIERNSGWRFNYDYRCPIHPPSKKRSQLLSQPAVMGEAMQLYRQVTAKQGQEKISSNSGTLSLA